MWDTKITLQTADITENFELHSNYCISEQPEYGMFSKMADLKSYK